MQPSSRPSRSSVTNVAPSATRTGEDGTVMPGIGRRSSPDLMAATPYHNRRSASSGPRAGGSGKGEGSVADDAVGGAGGVGRRADIEQRRGQTPPAGGHEQAPERLGPAGPIGRDVVDPPFQ